MEQPVVSPPKSMQNYWRDEVIRQNPDTVEAYLARHNLEELPLPEYITPDTAIYYRKNKSDQEAGLQALADTLEMRDAREKRKAKPVGCTLKGCRRRFDTERGMKRHFTVKHREV